MIARLWNGTTSAATADGYFEYIKQTGVAGLLQTTGNRGVYVFRQVKGNNAHFLMLSLWDSIEAIERFAGADIDKARLYPSDREFLTHFDETVNHYDMLLFHPKEP